MYRLSKQFGKDPYTVNITKAGSSPHNLELAIKKMNSPMFVNSMSDTFHYGIPDSVLDEWFRAFAQHPEKQFQILTKRPERAVEYFKTRDIPENCWIGTSVGIKEAVPRIDLLKQIRARMRFVSIEPLIEDIGESHIDFKGIQWAIIGGESDLKAPRPMEKEWVANVFWQLRRDGVAIFFKQWGGIGGDGAGGDMLNGRKIQEMPIVERSYEGEWRRK